MATKKRFTEMVKHHTFEKIEREIKHRYRNAKDKNDGKALNSEEFGLLVRKVFADWNIPITKGSQAQHWYTTLKTNFGSRGGVKNASNPKTKKVEKPKDEQTEFTM